MLPEIVDLSLQRTSGGTVAEEDTAVGGVGQTAAVSPGTTANVVNTDR